MVLTGDDDVVAYEPRSLLAREEADDERRKVVRSVLGEKRDAMDCKRDDCMMGALLLKAIGSSLMVCRCRMVLGIAAKKIVGVRLGSAQRCSCVSGWIERRSPGC